MIVVHIVELNARSFRMGILGQFADLRLREDGDMYATKGRHLVLHKLLSTVAHQPVSCLGVGSQVVLISIMHKLAWCV